MPSWGAYVVVFAVAFGTTFVLTPVLRRVALRYQIVAVPNERRVHTVPVPYLGGVAMLLGFLGALGVAWRLHAFRLMFEGSSVPLGVALGAVILCLVGTVDDVREVSAPAKTAGMVLGGSVMYLLGVSLLYFRVPFAGSLLVLGPDLAPLISVLWVIGMVNAVNFIDGLDGLAAGIVAIAAGAFFLYGHRLALPSIAVIGPDNPSPLIAVIVAGLCLGFLPFNFNPARIFMGDGGALMLGGLMGAATILVGGQSNEQFSGQVFFFFAPLFIPFFVMGVPIVDTAFAIVRRATKRVGLAEADKDHLHHRLMRLGHGQRRSVVILWLWSALLSGFVLYPVYTRKGDAVVPFGVGALALVLLTWFHPGSRRAREEGELNGQGEPEGSVDSVP
ncbi:MAG: undecaprenyl/decaprenyl-phosphate alpha-N-acetylglucosaminyl 1-phosphate transferase [Actinomycetota bacterium]|nr:undecaprenyl/decaprenyl-phosphate alpha-N-acetylglucosaminyl 1-phosphate transferase [Actinomycetota bacterium]